MAITLPPLGGTRPVQYSVGDTRISGADTQIQPERLSPSSCQDIVNLLWDGGSLTTRPGMTGQLTSAMASAVYFDRCRYVKADGTILLPFASGGKLYYLTTGGTSATEIVKPGPTSFSFTNSGRDVRLTTVGKWLYILDAGDSSFGLWRVNLESGSTAEDAGGIDAPTVAPLATVGGAATIFDAGNGTWVSSTDVGENLIPSGDEDFPSASTFWSFRAGATGSHTMPSDSPSTAVELDADGGSRDYVTFASPVALPTSTWFEYPRLALAECRYSASDNAGANDPEQTLEVQVFGCDSSGNRFQDATISQISDPVRGYPTKVFRGLFDLRAFSLVEKIDVLLQSPSATGVLGVNVRQFSLTIPINRFAVAADGDWQVVSQGEVIAWQGTLYANGAKAIVSLPSSTDWSTLDTVVVDVVKGTNVESLTMRLGFTDGADWWYSESADIDASGSVAFDISNIKSYLTAVDYVGFQALNDIPMIGLEEGGSMEVFRVGKLRIPGNLTPGTSRYYRWGLLNVTASTSSTTPFEDIYALAVKESNAGPYSTSVAITSANRRVTLDLKGSIGTVPTLDSQATHIVIWAIGTVSGDGDTRDRLIAVVPVASSVAWPAATTQDSLTNTSYWDSTNYIFYDNRPDEDISSGSTYRQGRDVAPTGATAMIEHAGRLWLARYDSTRKVNEVYASWLMDAANDFPYFTYAPDDDDPEVSTKGTLLGVGGQGSGDRIVGFGKASLEPSGGNIGSSLMVMRQSAPPAIIDGWRSGQALSGAFRLWPSSVEQGGGCLSAQGVEMVNGQTLYLGATGIVSTMGTQLNYQSRAMEKRLSLSVLGKTRYSKVFLLWHDRRLWCFVIGSGSTDGEALVWDERSEGSGWSRVSGIAGWTSGISLSGGEDTGDLYLGGRDGQIYKMAGTVASPSVTRDRATPSGTDVAIAYSLTTRRHGQSEAEGVARYSLSYPHRLFVDAYYGGTAGTTTALSWTIRNEYGHTTGGTGYEQNLPAGRIVRTEITEVGDVRGKVHEVLLSGSVTKSLTLHSYLMLDARGGAVR